MADLFAGGLKITTPLLWLMFACTLLSMHFLNSWVPVILNQAGLSEVQTAFTNGALHWGGAIAAVCTVFLLGRMGLSLALALLLLGFAGLPDHREHGLRGCVPCSRSPSAWRASASSVARAC